MLLFPLRPVSHAGGDSLSPCPNFRGHLSVEGAGAIQHGRAVVDQRAPRGQQLALGAGVGVALMVVGEVVTQEGSVL